MNEIIFLIEEALAGGYQAKALGESIFTDADTIDELHAKIRDAVRCHFQDDVSTPETIRLRFIKEVVIAYNGGRGLSLRPYLPCIYVPLHSFFRSCS